MIVRMLKYRYNINAFKKCNMFLCTLIIWCKKSLDELLAYFRYIFLFCIPTSGRETGVQIHYWRTKFFWHSSHIRSSQAFFRNRHEKNEEQDRSHQGSTRPALRPCRQWLPLDFEVLGRTDGQSVWKQRSLPAGTLVSLVDQYFFFLLPHIHKNTCCEMLYATYVQI